MLLVRAAAMNAPTSPAREEGGKQSQFGIFLDKNNAKRVLLMAPKYDNSKD